MKDDQDFLLKVIYISGFLDLFGVSLILPLILTHLKTFHISHLTAGLTVSLYGAIQLFSSPMVGCWSDCYGRRCILLICLLATCFGYVILGQAKSLTCVIFSRGLTGIFKHSQTISRAFICDFVSKHEQSKTFGIFNAMSSMGFIVGPMLGGHLYERDEGFLIVCNTAALIFFCNLVMCYVLLPSVQSTQQYLTTSIQCNANSTISSRKEKAFLTFMYEWHLLWEVFVLRFLLSFASLVFRSNFTLHLSDRFGSSAKVIGYIISFQGVVSALSGFLSGRMSLYYGDSIKELLYCIVVLCSSLLAITFAPSVPLVLLCLIPLCASSAIIRVTSVAITLSMVSPNKAGSVTGLGQSIASLCRMTTPMVAGGCQQIAWWGPGVAGTSAAFTAGMFLFCKKEKLKHLQQQQKRIQSRKQD